MQALLSCWFRVVHERERESASLTEALHTCVHTRSAAWRKNTNKGGGTARLINSSILRTYRSPSHTPSVPKREQCPSGARWLTIPAADLPVDGAVHHTTFAKREEFPPLVSLRYFPHFLVLTSLLLSLYRFLFYFSCYLSVVTLLPFLLYFSSVFHCFLVGCSSLSYRFSFVSLPICPIFLSLVYYRVNNTTSSSIFLIFYLLLLLLFVVTLFLFPFLFHFLSFFSVTYLYFILLLFLPISLLFSPYFLAACSSLSCHYYVSSFLFYFLSFFFCSLLLLFVVILSLPQFLLFSYYLFIIVFIIYYTYSKI